MARKGYSSVARTRGPMAVGEMKYFDGQKTNGIIPASTDWTATEFDPDTVNCFFAPTVGTAVNQRVGREVRVMKWKVKGLIYCNQQVNQAIVDNPACVRLIFYQDTQTNSTQAQGEEVMTTTASAITNIGSFQNINNFGRFKVLYDKVHVIQGPTVTYDGTNIEQGGLAKYFKFSVNMKGLSVRFNATAGGTCADIVDNSFHLLATTADASFVPALFYASRVSYKDL